MYEELLRDCGLTQNESLVYLTLLKIGKSKSGEIVNESKVSGGKIYETLYKLVDKGLVKSISENNVKYFIANDPSAILEYLNEKDRRLHERRERLSNVLPDLELLKKNDAREDDVALIKGIRGISPIVHKALENAKDIKIMGITSSKNVRYNNFWRGWHKERIGLRKKAKMIFSDRNTDYWKFFNKLGYTEVREISHLTPSAVMIIDDNVFIFSYGDEITCIHIASESISTSFSLFFDDLWKIAKS